MDRSNAASSVFSHRKFQTDSLLLFALIGLIFALVTCSNPNESNLNILGKIEHPEDNLPDAGKIALGKKLFFDKRLSRDESISCASCHQPQKAFSDGKKISVGVAGRIAFRNAPSLYNVAYNPRLMMDGAVESLERQALVPLLDHNEMDMDLKILIQRLRKIPEYRQTAKKYFKRELDAYVLTRSLAAFERTLISDNSPFDRFYYRGEKKAITADAQKGWELFSGKFKCTACHRLPYFTNFETAANGSTTLRDQDLGRFRITGDSADLGKFKVPSLRNVAQTAPYLHNGQFATLDEVLDFYQKGKKNGLNLDRRIKRQQMSIGEKQQLKAFLMSLADLQK